MKNSLRRGKLLLTINKGQGAVYKCMMFTKTDAELQPDRSSTTAVETVQLYAERHADSNPTLYQNDTQPLI